MTTLTQPRYIVIIQNNNGLVKLVNTPDPSVTVKRYEKTSGVQPQAVLSKRFNSLCKAGDKESMLFNRVLSKHGQHLGWYKVKLKKVAKALYS